MRLLVLVETWHGKLPFRTFHYDFMVGLILFCDLNLVWVWVISRLRLVYLLVLLQQAFRTGG